MSKEDLWAVVGRAKLDLNFGGALLNDFAGEIKKAGYDLDPSEIEDARQQISQTPQSAMPPMSIEDLKLQQAFRGKQMQRVSDLWSSVNTSIEAALNSAARTYKIVTWMNTIMFGSGLSLFVFAAIYGALSHQLLYGAIFCGLGAGTFVSVFLLGAIDKTQTALSNLVQVDIAFTNYLEQVSFWENYAQRPQGIPPMPELANIERASAGLQQRTLETIQLLQEYVENTPVRRPPTKD